MRIVTDDNEETEKESITMEDSFGIIANFAGNMYVSLNSFQDDEPDFAVLNAATELEVAIKHNLACYTSACSPNRFIEVAQYLPEIMQGDSNPRRFVCSEDMTLNASAFLIQIFSADLEMFHLAPTEMKMPLYELKCPKCGYEDELIMSYDSDCPECPKCKDKTDKSIPMKKQISRTSFHLKGSGWYKDHYGLKNPNKQN